MTIKDMIERYSIIEGQGARRGQIYISRADLAKRDGAVEAIKARKGEIIAYFAQQREAAEQRRREHDDKVAAIEGLAEIQAALDDIDAWQREFDASFDSEDGGGFGVRPRPEYDLDAMKRAHPRAAAYIRAQEYASKDNDELSAIGRRAEAAILDGDYDAAIARMDEELRAFTERHLWD